MLSHTATLGLLPERPGSNRKNMALFFFVFSLFFVEDGPLVNFPLATVLILVRETVATLRDAKPDLFLAPAHAEHALRTAGHAFALPLAPSHLETVQSAMKLYKAWMLEEKKRPRAMALNESALVQMMVRQLSQVFKVRAGQDAEQLGEQVKLCESALSIYSVMASQGDRLEGDTWKTLMLSLLGIADYLWTSIKSSNERSLASMLAERVGFVLFETWVLSGREDPALWSRLAKLFPGWCHVMSVVVTWKGVCVALTQRMLNLLYGPTEGLPFVKLSIAPKARVDGRFVYYAWSRYLNLLGNLLESTASPETFLEVFVAVREMVYLFLEVGRESVKMNAARRDENSAPQQSISAEQLTAAGNSGGAEKSVSGVNGNTLLQLFGKFVFDAVISNNPARSAGTSLATQIMCDIFVVCSANTIFKRSHLARFYTALSRILLTQEVEVSATLVAVLRYCGSLFTYGLPGSHILIPAFMHAVSRVLTCRKNVSDSILASDVRHYALSILSTLLCLPEHFQSVPLYPVTSNFRNPTGVLSVKTYKDLNQFHRELISRTISNSAVDLQEDNSDNINLLLWIHFVHGVQTSKFDDIVLLCNRILSSSGNYSLENVLTALKCLSCLTNFVQPGLGPRCAKTVLDFLSREMRSPSQDASAKFVMTSCLYTLCDWVICDRTVLDEKGMLDNISSTIMAILTNESEVKTLREAARYMLVSLINNYGQWPAGVQGNLTMSSCLTESSVLTGSNTARYFCLEGVGIITVVERRDLQDTMTIILRDKKGRWVYNMSLAQVDEKTSNAASRTPSVPPAVVPVVLSDGPSIDPARLVSIYSFFKSKNLQHPLINAGKPSISSQQAPAGPVKLPAALSPPSRPVTNGSLFRLALSNLGMLSLHQKERFHAIDQTMDFYRDLKQLDLLSERECQRIGVCYVPSGVRSLEDTFMNKNVSADYLRFLSSLGWGYNVRENRQNVFIGGTDDPAFGAEVLPYYSNYSSEMIFFPVHLLSCSLENKVRLMNTANVVIVYCEDLDGYNPALFPFNRAHIVVNPLLSAGLYHTSFFNTSKKTGFDTMHYAIGPISDKTVLSQALLAPMVRLTASNAFRSYQPPAQFNTRQTKISQMIDRHAKTLSPAEFYALLFKELPEDQLPPPVRLTTREVLTATGKNDSSNSLGGSSSISAVDLLARSPRVPPPRSSTPPLPSAGEKSEKSEKPSSSSSLLSPSPSLSPPPLEVRSGGPPLPSQSRLFAPESDPPPALPLDAPSQHLLAAKPRNLVSSSPVIMTTGPPLPSQSVPAKTAVKGSSTAPVKLSGTPPLPAGSPMVARKAPPMPGASNIAPTGGGNSVRKEETRKEESVPANPPRKDEPPPIPAAPVGLTKKTIRLPSEAAGRAKRPPVAGRGTLPRAPGPGDE